MMYLNNIIDQLVDILSVYYISYRKRINKHINISFDDISDKTKTFIKSYISRLYYQRFQPTDKVYDIGILMWPYEKYYEIESMSSYDDKMNECLLYDIMYNIISHFNDDIINIDNDSNVISINVCPFDGITIKHGLIMYLFNLYFY